MQPSTYPPLLKSSLSNMEAKKCWSHKQQKHTFFLSYRVSSEGSRCPLSQTVRKDFILIDDNLKMLQEPEQGLVQMVYNQLAVKKFNNGNPVFVFLDKHCLNYGQNWENGFLAGLKSSQIIVLLMSNQVCLCSVVSPSTTYIVNIDITRNQTRCSIQTG